MFKDTLCRWIHQFLGTSRGVSVFVQTGVSIQWPCFVGKMNSKPFVVCVFPTCSDKPICVHIYNYIYIYIGYRPHSKSHSRPYIRVVAGWFNPRTVASLSSKETNRFLGGYQGNQLNGLPGCFLFFHIVDIYIKNIYIYIYMHIYIYIYAYTHTY